MFKKMLLDALEKAPPRSVDDLAVFFERSRARLEQSLDKGQVSGEERERYLAQFQSGLNEAQVDFLNTALETQHQGASGYDSASSPIDALKLAFKQPVIWGALALVLLLGLAIGLLIGG
ncbi:MAG: hypothetical protein ACE360_01560 [Hyphomicrobiales bacterium]